MFIKGGFMKKLNFVFIIIILLFPITSCSRVEVEKGELKFVQLDKLDAIPLEYGSLVGITPNQDAPNWAQLWFEDEQKTIRVVSVQFFEGKILKDVTVIPRN